MLNEKKMMTKLANNNIITKDITITTGSSQYDGHYYADGSMGLSNDNVQFISANVLNAAVNQSGGASNVFAYAEHIYNDTLRLWSMRANVKATIRIAYRLGGVIRNLFYANLPTISGRGWACA